MTRAFCIPKVVHVNTELRSLSKALEKTFLDHEQIVEHKYLENGHTNM